MNSKTLLGLFVLMIIIVPAVLAQEISLEQTSVARLSGDSPEDIIHQLDAVELDLNHATYYSKNSPGTKWAKNRQVIESNFNSHYYESYGDVNTEYFESNEFLIVDDSKVKDLDYLQDDFEDHYPLFIYNVDEGLEEAQDLTRYSHIIGTNHLASDEFLHSIICNAGGEKSLGHIYRESRNSYLQAIKGGFFGTKDQPYLILKGYQLLGNPLSIIKTPNYSRSEIKEICKDFLGKEETNFVLQSAGPDIQLSYTANETFIDVNESLFVYADMVLPVVSRSIEMPIDAIVTNVTYSYENPVVLNVSLCEDANATIEFRNVLEEDRQIGILNFYPYDISCNELTLYQDIYYDIEYVSQNDLIIDVSVPERVNPGELFEVFTELKSGATNYTSIEVVRDGNSLILLDEINFADASIMILSEDEPGKYTYDVIFDLDGRIEKRSVDVFVESIIPSSYYEINGSDVTYKLIIDNYASSIPINISSELVGASQEELRSVNLIQGKNQFSYSFNGLEKSQGSYELRFTIHLPDRTIVHTDSIVVNHPPQIIVDEVNTFRAGDFIVRNGTGGGQHQTIPVTIYDQDGDEITFLQDIGVFQTGPGSEGNYTVNISVTDGYYVVVEEFIIEVGPENHVPEVVVVNDSLILPGEIYTLYIDSIDLDYDPLTFEVNDSRFVKLDDGLYEWNTSLDDVGVHIITYSVDDGRDVIENQFTLIIGGECIESFDCSSGLSCGISTCQNYQCVEDLSNCCFENITQTNWSDWQNVTECGVDNVQQQIRYAVAYDQNSCGTYENITINDSRNYTCDYCLPVPINVSGSGNISLGGGGWFNGQDGSREEIVDCQIDDTYTIEKWWHWYDSLQCFELTGLDSDGVNTTKNYYNETGTCDYCTPQVEERWYDWENTSECQINDIYTQQKSSYKVDINGCFEITGLLSDMGGLSIPNYQDRNQTCDYCQPQSEWSNWTDWQDSGECLVNNSIRQISYRESYDSNACSNLTGLVSDEFTILFDEREQYVSCDYCVPNILNTSWGEWENYTYCQTDDAYTQISYRNEFDSLGCYDLTGLESDVVEEIVHNKTQELECDYCTPQPVLYTGGGGLGAGGPQVGLNVSYGNQCLSNDTFEITHNSMIVDSFACYSQTGLESDYVDPSINESLDVYSCDYCQPVVEELIGECVLGQRNVTFSHANSCCEDTGLSSDCTLPESYVEECPYYDANVFVTSQVYVGEPFTYEVEHSCVTCDEINITIQTPLQNITDVCVVENNSCTSTYDFVATRQTNFTIYLEASSSDGDLSYNHTVDIISKLTSCEIDLDCSDGNIQTLDSCNAGICEYNFPVLEKGWNLISFPYHEKIQLSDVNDGCDIRGMPWAFSGRRYTRVSEFEPGVGYWFYSSQECELKLERELTPLIKLNNSYQRGWNLVGTPINGISIADFPCEYTNISWGWDRQRMVRNDVLSPHEGYWIYLPQGCEMPQCTVDLDCGEPTSTSSCEGDGFAEYTSTPTCVENVCEVLEEREITGMCAARSADAFEETEYTVTPDVNSNLPISSTSIVFYRDFESKETVDVDLEVFCDGTITDYWIDYRENSFGSASMDVDDSSVVYSFSDRSYDHGLDATLFASCEGEPRNLAIVDYRGVDGRRMYLDLTCDETLVSANNYWHASGYEEELRTYSNGVKYVYHPLNDEDDYFLYAEGELSCS